jgi:glycosyltransferase involved in cell wall biosynthesis
MRAAVASVLDQDYAGDIEVIVVFDGCDVELPDLPERPGRRLRGVANERTRGLAGARNTGIVEAAHDFVAFLDDDDAWRPTKLRTQMAVFAGDDEVALVGTGMRVVHEGRGTHTRLVPHATVTFDELIGDRLAGLHSSSFVFRRSTLVDDVGMIDERLPGSYGEDYDVLLRTAQIAPIRVVNEPLVDVRWTGQSYFYGKWNTYAEALQYLLAQHPEFAQQPLALARLKSQIGFALAAAGRRAEGRRWAREALAIRRTDLRAWLALLVSVRLAHAGLIARAANAVGRGL